MDEKKSLDSAQIPHQDWDSIREQEVRLLRAMTIRQGILQYQEMQALFEWQMQQTEHLFGENHRQALIELQDRLYKYVHWLSSHGKSSPIDPEDSKTPK